MKSSIVRCERLITTLENRLGKKAVFNAHPDDIWSSNNLGRSKSTYYEKCGKCSNLLARPFESACPQCGFLQKPPLPFTVNVEKPDAKSITTSATSNANTNGDTNANSNKKEKEQTATTATTATAASAAPAAPAKKPAAAENAAATPAKVVDDVELVQHVDFRVALIISAKKHPEADRLYIEQIDAGDAGGRIRTIVSGLAESIPLDQMQQRRVIICANLKPMKFKNVESQGMVLAAVDADGKVNLVEPPAGAKVGERVIIIENQKPADEVLNPKHKIWEAIQPNLHTDGDCIARWKDLPFKTSDGVCIAPGKKNSVIR